MRHLGLLLTCVIILTGATACEWRLEPPPTSQVEVTPLVDTLQAVFIDLHEATLTGDNEQFFGLLDPNESEELKRLVKQYGYISLKTYLERQFAQWPDLDTLELTEVRQAGRYARLTYSGFGTRFGYKAPRIRYTFLLYRRHVDGWRLTAVTDIERDQFDPYGYGYEFTVHETDLPPKLRFPRAF